LENYDCGSRTRAWQGKGYIPVTAAANQLVERHRSWAGALLVLGFQRMARQEHKGPIGRRSSPCPRSSAGVDV